MGAERAPANDDLASRLSRCVLGIAMLAHFVLLAALKVHIERPGEILWISHVALLLGGIGLVLARPRLVSSALISVAVLHALWLVDALCGVCLGTFPLGLTRYLLDCDLRSLAATSHHLYLAPILAAYMLRDGRPCRHAWLAASAVMTVVTVLSRFALPPELNVNFAHAVMPRSTDSAFVWMNQQSSPVFLTIHLSVVTTCAILPAQAVLNFVCARLAVRAATARTREGKAHVERSVARVHAH